MSANPESLNLPVIDETVGDVESLHSRFDQFLIDRIRNRRGVTRLPKEIKHQNVFVVPTRFGFWFGLLLVLMIAGGLNFNNNLTLMLTFLLAALALMTTVLAYRNLGGLSVTSITTRPVFAGEPARFFVQLKNPEQRGRFAVQLISEAYVDCKDIEPESGTRLTAQQPTLTRGWMDLQAFRIENRFPLGLFRAWSIIIPAARCLVYPKPAAQPPPLPQSGYGEHGYSHKLDGEHFHGLREYRPGDPLRRIAWRASARHQKLHTRQMESPIEDACEINWYLMGDGGVEEKIAIMTAWILRAERQEIPYSLELPTSALPADLGSEHRDACLEMLALFEPPTIRS